ncbi:hypothetical protein COHA_005103 [Chlorella ohadii]|uniref:Tetratricopeptide repeat protein 1 n=1 Tax=Chlorella ohadii TaxID=2649997 RepID=A0AAD5DRI0_9CHLO|nr:hypothetical protein COHA_005103 [Chlorella ohadii]
MVLIEDITEQEAAREAAEAAAAAQAAAAAAAEERARAAAAAQQATAAASAQYDSDSDYEEEEGEEGQQGRGAAGPAGAAGEQEGGAVVGEAPQPPRELTEEEKERLQQAEVLKKEGNELYARDKWEQALERYSAALEAAPAEAAAAPQRADCSAAVDLHPRYAKALLRRSTAYEKLDDLERALADAQKVLELDPGNAIAQKSVQRLTPIVEERREKLKEEMMGKLKDLGNMVLGKFGLSVDNFKAEKDPATGSYSIKFQQSS